MQKKATTAGLVALVFTVPVAQAGQVFEDFARVLEVTPQYEEVNVPRKECVSEFVPEQTRRRGSMAGPIIGGIAGGVLGAQVGKGNGRVASSAAGAAIGAIVGDRLSQRDNGEIYEREIRRCEIIDHWETRLTGYRVIYSYLGHEHATILPYDPGRRLRVRVAVDPLENAGSNRWER